MDLTTLQTITNNFVKELQDATSGKKTSLPFALNQLPSTPLVIDGEEFQLLVIGGSVCKIARAKKEGEQIMILSQEEKDRVSFATKEDFFKFLDQEIFPDVSVVAFNFAYEMKSVFENNILDGILLRPAKENTFTGLVGEKMGATIAAHIKTQRNQIIKVSCANDTICLLLSGLTKNKWDNLAAGIVGTGFNFAIFLDKHTAVNLESGSFKKFPQSDEGKEIDATSTKPGEAIYEKEVSGGYLFTYFNLLLQKRGIDFSPTESTQAMDELARQNIPHVSDLAKEVLDHSAALAACQLAGITKFQGKNMTFVMEGSLFWKALDYKETVTSYFTKLAPEYKVSFINIDHSSLLGAARLVA